MDDREINKFVGMKIKEFRKNKKLTQQGLADLVGVKNSAISNYEQGTRIPKRDFLFRVANALGVSIDEFFPIQNEETSSTLSEINKISSQLEESRQKIVLNTASSQLEEQEKAKRAVKSKPKVTPLFDINSPLTDEELQEAVDEAVAFDGVPLTDREKELYKHLLRETWEEDHGRG
ncbi:MAG: helix-turn-helix domain-containing protein [Bacillota bacterium]|nr:helix-turn-helix domain-containing protein [Bacillota bacterium]